MCIVATRISNMIGNVHTLNFGSSIRAQGTTLKTSILQSIADESQTVFSESPSRCLRLHAQAQAIPLPDANILPS